MYMTGLKSASSRSQISYTSRCQPISMTGTFASSREAHVGGHAVRLGYARGLAHQQIQLPRRRAALHERPGKRLARQLVRQIGDIVHGLLIGFNDFDQAVDRRDLLSDIALCAPQEY